MPKSLTARYYQENKERLLKNLVKDIKFFLKKKKKSNNLVMEVTKISQKIKNKSLLSIGKNIMEWERMLYYNYRKVFLKVFLKKYFFRKYRKVFLKKNFHLWFCTYVWKVLSQQIN